MNYSDERHNARFSVSHPINQTAQDAMRAVGTAFQGTALFAAIVYNNVSIAGRASKKPSQLYDDVDPGHMFLETDSGRTCTDAAQCSLSIRHVRTAGRRRSPCSPPARCRQQADEINHLVVVLAETRGRYVSSGATLR